MEIRGDLSSYLHIKCGGKPFCTSLEAFTKDEVSEQALGDLGITNESRMAAERLFQPIRESKETIMFQWKKLPLARSAEWSWGPGSDQAQKDTYSPMDTHTHAHLHTCTDTHTAHTHA